MGVISREDICICGLLKVRIVILHNFEVQGELELALTCTL